MEAEEKAKQLVDKMYVGFIHSLYSYKAKQCALIAVDEIINECGDRCLFSKCDYWQEVKIEIKKL
jgi:hypothetical protein